jgi:hypothetical protein
VPTGIFIWESNKPAKNAQNAEELRKNVIDSEI